MHIWSALVHSQENSLFQFPMWPMAILWFICSLAELNRAPMDLPEAEREQVAGYNVEYASMGFALFFIAEYANMIFMGRLTALLFFGGGLPVQSILSFLPYSFWLAQKTTFVVFLYIWVRATLPRYKYSQLMRQGWKRLLPLRLAGFVRNAVFVFVAQTLSIVFHFFLLVLLVYFGQSLIACISKAFPAQNLPIVRIAQWQSTDLLSRLRRFDSFFVH